MKIAIVGAGFTGLAAAYKLVKNGHEVTIFEKDQNPGGLAVGYKEKEWDWSLEKHYHHWFTNDTAILNLAKEINHNVIIKTPQTNWYVFGNIYKFVSLKAALTFPLLTPIERIRQLATLGILRINPFWKPLEKYKTNEIMPKLMGEKAWNMLWKTILVNKFGNFANDISLAWFWARIKKRTQSLAYPEKGFLPFANHLVQVITKNGGSIFFEHETISIEEHNAITVTTKNKNGKIEKHFFDKVLVTLPSFLFLKITPQLPDSYKQKLVKLKGLGATNMILRLRNPFFKDNTYWLSVADSTSPIMAIVEHTNFMNKKYYNNEHLVYLGNYMPIDHPNFLKEKKELLELYDPFLQKINPEYRKHLIDYTLFKAPFAQPIIPTNYSRFIPSLITPLANVYLSNIEQVYPWDRGTNYAVQLGEKAATYMTQDI